MHKLILLVREMRQKGAFKVSTRLILVFLMVLGLRVATMPLTNGIIPEFNDKLAHLLVFFCFALLTDLATVRTPFWLWKGLPLVGYGLLIEVSQSFTEFRQFEWADLVADTAGIALYYGIKYWIRLKDMKLYE